MDPRLDLASAYDAHVLDREAKGEPEWRSSHRVRFAAELPPGGRVLELGAGVGYTAQWFAEQGFEVLATDLSPANVDMCRAKGVEARVADLMNLDLEGSFDGVWAASCLMHVPNAHLGETLASIAGLLNDSGLFWAGTWGGVESEGIWEEDWYRPRRFYSIRSDEQIQSFYRDVFEISSFVAFDPEPDIEWHYQTALLRPKTQ